MITLTLPVAGSLAMFAFVSSITPGPNNAMLLASGANFGFRASLPHAAGVLLGFLGLVLVCGLGLGGVFRTYPLAHMALKWGGAAYLLYLAFKIATSRAIGAGQVGAEPMTFLQAVAFQFVNPKGWAMALGTVATYLPSGFSRIDLLLAVLIFGALNGPSILTWMGSGVALRHFLERPSVLRVFNIGMGLLLALSVAMILVEES
jgi:threonine/homoserine/homoserine lactone efflux protein